jgi:hypothetical protein
MINWVYKCIANNLWRNIFHTTTSIKSWIKKIVIDDDTNNWGTLFILKNYASRLDGNKQFWIHACQLRNKVYLTLQGFYFYFLKINKCWEKPLSLFDLNGCHECSTKWWRILKDEWLYVWRMLFSTWYITNVTFYFSFGYHHFFIFFLLQRLKEMMKTCAHFWCLKRLDNKN